MSRRSGRSGPPRRRSTGARSGAHRRPGPFEDLPTGPVPIDTGTAELVPEPGDPRTLTVMVNGVPSSHLDLDDPTWLEFEYMQQMAAVIDLLPPGPLDAVHLGAAACTLPRWVEATRPGSRQLAVDRDAELLRLVREWFALPRSPRLRLRAAEARLALSTRPSDSADVVVRDVFAPDVTPDHLTTVEFAREVARVLRPGGVYLANCVDRPPLDLARSELATVREVFADVALSAEPAQLKGRRHGNLVVIATTTHAEPDLAHPSLVRALRTLPVPVHLLHGAALDLFVGTAPPRWDPADAEDRASTAPTDHPIGGTAHATRVTTGTHEPPAAPTGPGR